MEYTSLKGNDSELQNKAKGKEIKIHLNININKTIYFKKKVTKNFLLILIIFVINYLISNYSEEFNINLLNDNYPNLTKFNEFSLSNIFKNTNNKRIFFNLTSISFSFDQINNIIKTDFMIDFYDQNKDIIIPSDLALYNQLHINCIMIDLSNSAVITSLANIIDNKHFICTELFYKSQNILFQIEIYQNNKLPKNKKFFLFSYKKNYFYKLKNIINNSLDCFKVNQDYEILNQAIHNINITYNNLKLKESYFLKPKCSTKFINLLDNKWNFINIYNYYFCICKGLLCKYDEIPQKYKYLFYLNVIDNNKNLYNKTDYLFGDFIYNEFSEDDAFPIFEKMIEQNLPAHYLTQNKDIYNKYCNLTKNCLTIIPVYKNNEIISISSRKTFYLWLNRK